MYVDVARKWVLWDFFHFGVLSCTDNSTKSANQPNLAVLGLSSALRMQLCSLSVADVIAIVLISQVTFRVGM